jgi:hypothetical protein
MPVRLHLAIATSLLAASCVPGRFGRDESARSLDAYREDFAAACGTRFDAQRDRNAFVASTREVRVLWLGDHHKDHALHTLQGGLLEEVRRTGRPLLLALEAIGSEDEADVGTFVAGGIDLDELRRRLRARWPGSWLDDEALDPWFYRWLLAFAREHGAPVRALEPIPRPPLGRRDPAIAARVAALAEAHADHLVVVVLGQAHLVGGGRQLDRCALPQLALGALPPASLPRPEPTPEPGSLLRSDGGLWWFAEVLTRAR